MQFQYYFFWSSASLIVFYLFYLLLLRRETFFVLNRIYLLGALCLSLMIPFFDLSMLIALPRIELVVSTFSIVGAEKLAALAEKDLNWLSIFYWIGVAISSILLLFKLVGVKQQMKLPANGAAFSFWKTKTIDQELSGLEVINAHENVHVKQFHTIDILLIEVVGVFFWFNPFIYCYRRSLKFLHEYLADEHAVRIKGSKKQYAMMLFLQNFKAGPALANTFYNESLLESRIRMLQRNKSSKYNLWKYSLCLPLIVLLTFLCSFKPSDFNRDTYNKVDKAASFPGGFEAFKNYLIKTARKVSPKNGKVKVSFVVETNGEITNEKIENGLDEATDKEALRVIKLSPKWEPALQNEKEVRSAYQLNINFQSDNQMNSVYK